MEGRECVGRESALISAGRAGMERNKHDFIIFLSEMLRNCWKRNVRAGMGMDLTGRAGTGNYGFQESRIGTLSNYSSTDSADISWLSIGER